MRSNFYMNNIEIKKVTNCENCPFSNVVIKETWIKCRLLEHDIYEKTIPKECPLRVSKILVKLQ